MKPVYLSATQIDNFRRCPRYWAWQKIAKLETPKAQSLDLGKRVHAVLEDYYQGKGTPNLNEVWRFEPNSKVFYPGKIASSMISEAIPADVVKRGILKAEMKFENTSIGKDYGIIYTGMIDAHWYDEGLLDIVDHKTSSDPEKWGKKAEALEFDTQRLLYSRVGIDLYKYTDKVSFALNYGSTQLQTSKNYWVLWAQPTDLIIKNFETEIEPIARYMADCKRAKVNPLELEPNPGACGMFRGCPFVDRCKLTKRQRIGALIMAKNALVDQLLKKNKEKKAEAPAPVEPDPINPPEQNEEIIEEQAPPKEEETKPQPKPKTRRKKPVKETKAEEKPKEIFGTVLTAVQVNEMTRIVSALAGIALGAGLSEKAEEYALDLESEARKILEENGAE